MSKAILFVSLLAACAADPTSVKDASLPDVTATGPGTVAGDDPAGWADVCDVLPARDPDSGPDCCSQALGCEPVTAECGVPGACLDYVCPLTDGRTAHVGICTAPDGSGSGE